MADPTNARTPFPKFMPAAPSSPKKPPGVDAGIQLKLTGAQRRADWYVTIKDAKCTAAKGSLPCAQPDPARPMRTTSSRSSPANWTGCRPSCRASSS